MSKKKKYPVSKRRFITIWGIATLLAWALAIGSGLLAGMTALEPVIRSSMFALSLLTGMIPAVFLAILQKQVVKLFLDRPMPGWTRISASGGLLAGVIMYLSITSGVMNPEFSFMLLLLPVAVLQWYWFSKNQFQGAWRWLEVAMISGVLFALPAQAATLFPGVIQALMIVIILVGYVALNGATMYQLLTQDNEPPAQKTAIEKHDFSHLEDNLSEDTPFYEEDNQKQKKNWVRKLWASLMPFRPSLPDMA